TYNTSKFVAQVPDQLARAEGTQASAQGEQANPRTARPEPVEGRASARGSTSSPRAEAAPTGKVATIKEIRRTVLTDAGRVTIELDGEVPFHEERIPNPSRVFLDLPGTRAAPPLVDRTLRFETDADIVRQIRVGRHPNNTTRVVLDADGVTSY